MAVSINSSFHTSLCETLYSDLISGREKFYYFIGNTIPWNINDLPPEFSDTVEEEMQIRNDIISIKKITASDISFATKRYDWKSGVVFDQYDSSVNLKELTFYVLTDEFNVYKCLSNANGSFSTEKPVGNGYSAVSYADGYVWKFMYNIPKSLRNKFLLPTMMPVFRSLNNSFYDDGNIREVFVKNSGSGYQSDSVISISISGGNPVTPAELFPVIGNNGSILEVKIINGGFYESAPTLTILGNSEATGLYPPNNSAKIFPVMKNGSIDRIYITDPGKNYKNSLKTTITVSGDGEGAILIPYIRNGEIVDVIVEDEGVGYTFAKLTVVSAFDEDTNSIPGSGASLEVALSQGNLNSTQSIVEQSSIPGAIHNIKVIDKGYSYSIGDQITISGDGRDAIAEAVIIDGRIQSVNMINFGVGYSYANISINSVEGYGAELKAIISPSYGHGRNAIEELLCDSLILSSNINNEPIHGVNIKNDYRQYGVLKNITEYTNSKEYNKLFGTSCFKITTENTSNFFKDGLVTISSTKSFTVVGVEDNFVILKPNDNSSIQVGEIGNIVGTLNNFNILSVTPPQINKFTGSIQYVNNQMGIDYSDQQLLTLKTVITL